VFVVGAFLVYELTPKGQSKKKAAKAAAQAFELKVGDTFDVQVALDAVQLRVAGLLPAGEYRQPLGMLDIGTAQWRLDRLGQLDRVDLRLAPGADPLAVQDAVRALLPPGVRLTTPGEASDDAVRLSRAYRSNLTALALVALFTGAFLVYATQSLAVARRRREIALLHAMGMTVREQLAASLLSGALVGTLGARDIKERGHVSPGVARRFLSNRRKY
jgi:putative ABC transport system permease protein